MKYKLLLAYDGTHYQGWQVQPNGISIQALVEQALSTALRIPTTVVGSGRTDSGVHALGQVAHFSHDSPFDPAKLLYSLNGLLPPDVRVLSLTSAAPDFHARYSAKGKVYRYYLQPHEKHNPFKRLYSYHLPYSIDREELIKATKQMIGTHDFTSFSNEAHRGSAARNPVRTLSRLDFIEDDADMYLEFEADGFLYRMVRNLMGTLLDCARGKLPVEQIPHIFACKDRKAAPPCIPPHGLFLLHVHY